MAQCASSPSFVRCGTSGLLSLMRWSFFGMGIVYGRFQWGHYYKEKVALMTEKKDAWEAENQELRDQVKGLETDLYRMRNPDWNKPVEGEGGVPTDPLQKMLYELGFPGGAKALADAEKQNN